MTSKYQDALDILENKSLVDELELEYQKGRINKSEVDELIERSIAEAEQLTEKGDAKYINEAGQLIIPESEMPVVRKLLKKLQDEGQIDENDSEAVQLSKMLNWISSYYETKSEATDKPLPSVEVKEKSEGEKDMADPTVVEKCDEVAVYKPFGGATSLAEAHKVMDAQKLESNVYHAYSMFGAVANNIMSAESETVENKLTAMNKLLTEFKAMLTPEKLMEMSQAEKEPVVTDNGVTELTSVVKSLVEKLDTVSVEISDLKNLRSADVKTEKAETDEIDVVFHPVTKEFDALLNDAVTKSGTDRQNALQGILNWTTEKFTVLDTELRNKEMSDAGVQPDVIKSAVTDAVNSEMAAMKAQITQLSQLVQQSLVSRANVSQANQNLRKPEIPVSRAILNGPIQNPGAVVQSKKLSIADIARISTVGH